MIEILLAIIAMMILGVYSFIKFEYVSNFGQGVGITVAIVGFALFTAYFILVLKYEIEGHMAYNQQRCVQRPLDLIVRLNK